MGLNDGMAENQPSNSTPPKVYRTRRSEIVSGVAVVISLPVLTFAWSIYKDIQDFKRANNAEFEKRIEAVREECRSATQQERERAKDAETEIRSDLREIRTQLLTQGRRR